mgnify:FL=1
MKQTKDLDDLVKAAVAAALLRLSPRDRTIIEAAISHLQHAGPAWSHKLGPQGAMLALASAGLWVAQEMTFAQEWMKWNKAP